MLDAMQNAILNKPDSILEKRPNSPSAEITKLENKFENILAKQVKESQAKEAQNKEAQTSIKESKADSKGKNMQMSNQANYLLKVLLPKMLL